MVAQTDDEALSIGRAAWPVFYDNFIKLWRKHGTQPVNAKLPPDFDSLIESGHAVAGSPTSVAALLREQIDVGALNYLIGGFVFGSMPHRDAVQSIGLFASDVMPALRKRERAAA